MLPSGESLHSGTGICGSCQGALELNANLAVRDGAFHLQGLKKASTLERLSDLNSLTLQRHIVEAEQQAAELLFGFGFFFYVMIFLSWRCLQLYPFHRNLHTSCLWHWTPKPDKRDRPGIPGGENWWFLLKHNTNCGSCSRFKAIIHSENESL